MFSVLQGSRTWEIWNTWFSNGRIKSLVRKVTLGSVSLKYWDTSFFFNKIEETTVSQTLSKDLQYGS